MEIIVVMTGMNLYDWCCVNDKKDILLEWSSNNDLAPCDFAPKSNKFASWICKYGHEYQMKIADKTRGRSCPYCAGKKVLIGFNDLETLYPDVCDDWDYENNNGLTPKDFTVKSGKKVNWKCHTCGYEWASKICNRTNGANCPNCAKKIRTKTLMSTIVSRNGSLIDSEYEYVKEWNYEKNIGIDISQVTIFSNIKYWWKCPVCGHEWKSSPNSRSKGHGCPECARQRTESKLQEKIRTYIENKYKFNIAHEKDCSILPKNPKTGFPMPYDNDIVISDTHLILETMGEQHFKITEFVKKDAKKRNVSPKEELEYIHWKDEYKKQFALSHGYYYLAIPYTAENDESYKSMIDTKIHEILSLNNSKQLPPEKEELINEEYAQSS